MDMMLRPVLLTVTFFMLSSVLITRAASAQDFQNISPCENLGVVSVQMSVALAHGKTLSDERAEIVDQVKKYPPNWSERTLVGMLEFIARGTEKDPMRVASRVQSVCTQQFPNNRRYTIAARSKFCTGLEEQSLRIIYDRDSGMSRANAIAELETHLSPQYLSRVEDTLNFIYESKGVKRDVLLNAITRDCLVWPEISFSR